MSSATSFDYGPVEVFVIEFEGDRPDPGVLDALRALSNDGTIRLLDLVIASRGADGSVVLSEITELAGGGIEHVELGLQGLVSESDVAESLEAARPGLSVAIAAFEHCWATTLAERVAAARGTVVHAERIPAPAVNQLLHDVVFVDAAAAAPAAKA